MHIRLRMFALLVLAVLAIGSASAHEPYRIIGTIEKFDTKTLLLHVKTAKSGTLEILFDAKTKVTKDKKKVPVSALKKGLSVVVDGLGDSIFDLEAVEVKIVPAPAPPK